MRVLYPGRIGIWKMLVFVEGKKPENPEKNTRSNGEDKQQTQPAYDKTRAKELKRGSVTAFSVILSIEKIPLN